MKTLIRTILAALAVLVIVATPSHAQVPWPQAWLDGEADANSYGDDSNVVFLIKYIGTSASGKIEVEADGDIVFTSGAQGSEAADTTLECPVSGALGGIIDVSDSACDTFLEVINIINDPDSDWRAVLLDALAADGANDTLLVTTSQQANSVTGLALKADTDVALESGRYMTDLRDLSDYMTDPSYTVLKSNWGVGAGRRVNLLSAYTVSTYGSGNSFLTCYSVKREFNSVSGALTETAVQMFTQANGATTVGKSFDASIFGPYGLLSKKGDGILCQIDNSAALASTTLTTYGLVVRHRN